VGWKDGAGGQPDKDNLLHSFAARYTTSRGEVLFFGSDRLTTAAMAAGVLVLPELDRRSATTASAAAPASRACTGTATCGGHRLSNGGTTSSITVCVDATCKKTTGDTVGACGDGNLRIKATADQRQLRQRIRERPVLRIVNPTTIIGGRSLDKVGRLNNGRSTASSSRAGST
jgi:hypothetical protein